MPEHADDTPLQGDDLETWASLATVLEWLPHALDAGLMQEAGLTHFEYGILYALATAPEHTLRMSTLAGYAKSSPSRLSRAVARLETRGWIARTADPDDGRSVRATLTAAGFDHYDLATPGHELRVRRLVLDPLTNAQKRQLRDASKRIMRAISADGERESLPAPHTGDPISI